MAQEAKELLRALAANDERSVRMVLSLRPDTAIDCPGSSLSPRVRALVRLAALVALDAPTATLRWAVELAGCAGADDREIVAVLAAVAPAIGLPRTVDAAPRLALAIGYELDAKDRH
jgi:alkylhydroperoxidase/carboxymuconolactone decarboxylase family protein YurZ